VHAEAGGTGSRVLVRRVWLGEPPAEAFAQQFEIYQGYTPAERQQHWQGSGWLTGDDPQVLADTLAEALDATGSHCLNLRIHAPGVTAEQARAQIAVLGAEVVPRLRQRLAAAGAGS